MIVSGVGVYDVQIEVVKKWSRYVCVHTNIVHVYILMISKTYNMGYGNIY